MRNRKSHKYKHYGPLPQNEFTATSSGKSADTAAVLKGDPQPHDVAYGQRLAKRQSQHPAGRRKVLGWLRTWKANGWRAELTARHDEVRDMGRDSTDV